MPPTTKRLKEESPTRYVKRVFAETFRDYEHFRALRIVSGLMCIHAEKATRHPEDKRYQTIYRLFQRELDRYCVPEQQLPTQTNEKSVVKVIIMTDEIRAHALRNVVY
jgi:hypothetical protein